MINTVRDALNIYEIVAGTAKPHSPCSIRYKPSDTTSARSFVFRLDVSYESWLSLLPRLGCHVSSNSSQRTAIYDGGQSMYARLAVLL